MENGLFRKQSLERISSPEQLHDYMHVTSPRLWMLLIAVAVLLIGFLAYASTATMENTMPIKVNVQNLPSYGDKEGGDESTMVGLYYSSLPTSYKDVVETGMKVRIGSEEGKIEMIAMVHPEDGDQELELIITMDNPSLSLRDGEYDAELVLESTTPISFLWN